MTIRVTLKNEDTSETRAVKVEQSGQETIIKNGDASSFTIHAGSSLTVSETSIDVPVETPAEAEAETESKVETAPVTETENPAE